MRFKHTDPLKKVETARTEGKKRYCPAKIFKKRKGIHPRPGIQRWERSRKGNKESFPHYRLAEREGQSLLEPNSMVASSSVSQNGKPSWHAKSRTFTFPDQSSHACEEKDQETPYVSIHASDIIL